MRGGWNTDVSRIGRSTVNAVYKGTLDWLSAFRSSGVWGRDNPSRPKPDRRSTEGTGLKSVIGTPSICSTTQRHRNRIRHVSRRAREECRRKNVCHMTGQTIASQGGICKCPHQAAKGPARLSPLNSSAHSFICAVTLFLYTNRPSS